MSELKPHQRPGDPNLAALLTWLVPGAGHLYLGRQRAALVAFVLIEGLYALGWLLSEGRTFEFLDVELRSTFATILTPEVANLGGMIAQMKLAGFGDGQLRPFLGTVELGAILTGLSGIANACCMAAAHLAARTGPDRSGGGSPRSGRHPALLAFAAWAVPGLGHWLQGRRQRALVVFVLLVGTFLLGTWFAEASNLSRERHFYYWSGQFLLGLPSILAQLAIGDVRVAAELPLGDVGLLYGCMPGLLNVLAMLDVFGVAERRWLGLEPDAGSPGAGSEQGKEATA